MELEKKEVKLHLGSGTLHKDGYINIDLRSLPGIVDIVADCNNVPFEKNTVDVIENYHLIEHFEDLEIKKLLSYWYSLLKTGGRLIVETPNFIGMVKRCLKVYEEEGLTRPGYIFGCHDKTGREGIFNDIHKWGLSAESAKEYFEKAGFKEIKVGEGTDYHHDEYGDGYTLRIEGIK